MIYSLISFECVLTYAQLVTEPYQRSTKKKKKSLTKFPISFLCLIGFSNSFLNDFRYIAKSTLEQLCEQQWFHHAPAANGFRKHIQGLRTTCAPITGLFVYTTCPVTYKTCSPLDCRQRSTFEIKRHWFLSDQPHRVSLEWTVLEIRLISF